MKLTDILPKCHNAGVTDGPDAGPSYYDGNHTHTHTHQNITGGVLNILNHEFMCLRGEPWWFCIFNTLLKACEGPICSCPHTETSPRGSMTCYSFCHLKSSLRSSEHVVLLLQKQRLNAIWCSHAVFFVSISSLVFWFKWSPCLIITLLYFTEYPRGFYFPSFGREKKRARNEQSYNEEGAGRPTWPFLTSIYPWITTF